MRLLALNILQPLIGADEWRCENFMDLIREHTGRDPWDEAAMREAFISVSLDTENGRTNLAQEMSGKAQSLRGAALLDEVFSAFVEPKLLGPTFVCHQPLEQSPLCRAWAEDPRLADRFEIYVNGMEVANAYQELNDPIEQRKRLEAQGVVDEDFIEALEHGMPCCAGMGIGIDRLCMIALGVESIRDVILFPLMRPEHG
jgi:lysyl-tRNA synthetase class 2